MSKADDLAAAARRKAEELTSRTRVADAERLAARDKQREAEAAKTARLKELRLAKEAADADAARAAREAGRPTQRRARKAPD
jgi:hypothetical protein